MFPYKRKLKISEQQVYINLAKHKTKKHVNDWQFFNSLLQDRL